MSNSTLSGVGALLPQSIGPAEVAAIAMGVTCSVGVLVLTGLKVSSEELQRIRGAGLPNPVFEPVLFMTLVSPVCVVCVSAALRLRADWAMGLMMSNVTPPTVTASVMSLLVGADVTLALSASMVVLACSLLTMPLCFAGGMHLYSLLGGSGDGQTVTVQLPIAQIVGAMAMLVGAAAAGVWANETLGEAAKETLQKRIKRGVIVAACCMAPYFLLHYQLIVRVVPALFRAQFYTGEQSLQFWLGALLVQWVCVPGLSLLMVRRLNAKDPTTTRDAVLCTIVRRNPGISMGMGALTFRSAGNVDFLSAMGILLAANMVNDMLVTMPMILIMRKLRYGRFCRDKQKSSKDDAAAAAAAEPPPAAAVATGLGGAAPDSTVCDSPVAAAEAVSAWLGARGHGWAAERASQALERVGVAPSEWGQELGAMEGEGTLQAFLASVAAATKGSKSPTPGGDTGGEISNPVDASMVVDGDECHAAAAESAEREENQISPRLLEARFAASCEEWV